MAKTEDYFEELKDITAQMERMYPDDEPIVKVFRYRQRKFYKRCMEKLRDEGRTWVAMVDTDEYISRNPNVVADRAVRAIRPTIMGMLDDATNRESVPEMSHPCIRMDRPEYIGHRDLPAANSTNDDTPHTDKATLALEHDDEGIRLEGENGTRVRRDLMTFRWRTKGRKKRPMKCMIDLSRIGTGGIPMADVNVHMPIRRLCDSNKGDAFLNHTSSTFAVAHYTGTYEQWSFRDDNRTSRTLDKWNALDRTAADGGGADADEHPVREWVPRFVSSVGGRDTALELLRGAGVISPKEG